MKNKSYFRKSPKDMLISAAPTLFLLGVALLAYRFTQPATPKRIVISTGNDEGDYTAYAKRYKDIIKEDGVELVIRPSSGAQENLQKLADDDSDVEVAFVQDGLGSPDKQPNLVSLGSLYYEPIWIFYRGNKNFTRLSQFVGKKIAVGENGGGTQILSEGMLKNSGVDSKRATFLNIGGEEAVAALKTGQVDAIFLIATADDAIIDKLIEDPSIHIMNLDQAQAITRQFPYLHHLVLPHGAIDLARNFPEQDINLVAPTATLLAKDTLDPALMDLLLKAATEVHSAPDTLENKDEFPMDKDYQFPIAKEAKRFYKSGERFWQRYLPFWLATLVDRFILLVIPLMALMLPTLRLIPRLYDWRIRTRIHQRYGELKLLEMQIKPDDSQTKLHEFLGKLDAIDERVNRLKVPLKYSEYIYSLRGHIDLVRSRLSRRTESSSPKDLATA